MVHLIPKKIIANNAIQSLPVVLQDLAITGTILLIADERTFKAAGEKVKDLLITNGYQLQECVLRRTEPLVPDERALGEILLKMEPGIELLLAVGSGSITDLTRYLSYKFNKPFVVVPTAPSMDGYTSSVAPLTIHGFKQTLPAVSPTALVAEVEVLANAPAEMIGAGLGDLLGKYTSLADWKLSSIVNEESYSEEIAVEVRAAVDQTVANFSSQITDGDQIKNLFAALIVSGEAMQKWGNSRPASGAEHHLAHFWEMQSALAGKKSYLHGTKVGIAVILVSEIYHQLFNQDVNEVKRLISQNKPETEEEYITRVKKVYGPLAGEVLTGLKGFYLEDEKRAVRQVRIIANWERMRNWVKLNVPTAGQLKELILRAGSHVDAKKIGVNEAMLKRTLQNAKEVRVRYTVLRLVEDIGWNLG